MQFPPEANEVRIPVDATDDAGNQRSGVATVNPGGHESKEGAALVQTKILGSLFDAPWLRGKKRVRNSYIDGGQAD